MIINKNVSLGLSMKLLEPSEMFFLYIRIMCCKLSGYRDFLGGVMNQDELSYKVEIVGKFRLL